MGNVCYQPFASHSHLPYKSKFVTTSNYKPFRSGECIITIVLMTHFDIQSPRQIKIYPPLKYMTF